MTAVVGVDPGTTTGIFAVSVSIVDKLLESEVRSEFTSYQLDAEKAVAALELQLRRFPEVLVACERYIITSRTARLTQQPAALELIGTFKQLCREYGAPFLLQMKSDAAHLARDKLLKRVGWFQRGQDHANDAARQALLALATADPREFNALLTYGSIVSTGR